jgi:hypothetical protein
VWGGVSYSNNKTGENIQNYVLECLVCRIYENLLQSKNKRITNTNLNFKMEKDFNRYFSKEETHIVNKCM